VLAYIGEFQTLRNTCIIGGSSGHYIPRINIQMQQMVGRNAPNRAISTRVEDWYVLCAVCLMSNANERPVRHFEGDFLSVWELKFTCIRVDWDNWRPITDASHDLRWRMIWDEATTRNVTGLLQILVIWWITEGFVEATIMSGNGDYSDHHCEQQTTKICTDRMRRMWKVGYWYIRSIRVLAVC